MTEVKIFGDDRIYSLVGPAIETVKLGSYEHRFIQRHGLYLIWNGKKEELVDVGYDAAFARECWLLHPLRNS